MPYLLRPPVVMEGPMSTGPLFGRYMVPKGVSLLVTGGRVAEVRYPDQDQCAAADQVYLGGHEYVVDDEAAQVLIDAGYSECMEPL